MTLKFDPTDDGFIVENDNGRTLCRVYTKKTVSPEMDHPSGAKDNDNNPVRVPAVVSHFPKAKHVVHFSGHMFDVAELQELTQQIAALEDKSA
jgi:hypothetical protein